MAGGGWAAQLYWFGDFGQEQQEEQEQQDEQWVSKE
jgi:hypothetical protein